MESEISVSGFRFHGRAASSMKPKECMQSISLAIMVADTVLMLTQADIPAVILTPIQTIGRCNTALSMMVIGMILAEINIKDIVDKAVILYSLQRLVIIPLIIYVILTILPVSHLVRGLSVILASAVLA